MKRILGFFVLLAFCALPTLAQEGSERFQVGGGYMYRSYNAQFSDRVNMNGWWFTADYSFVNWLALAADVDGAYASPGSVAVHQYTYTFGPRIYPLGHHKITPFAEALFGGSAFQVPDADYSDNAFAMSFGGGVDLSLSRRLAIRLGQFDYEQTRNFGGGSPGSPNQNNFKFKAGVLLRF